MSPLGTALVATLVSALVAGGLGFVLLDSGGDAITPREDGVLRTNERLIALEDRLADADREIERLEKLLADAEDLVTAQPARIGKLEADLRAMRSRLDQRPDGARTLAANGEGILENAEELEELVAARVEKQVEESEKKARRNRFKQWAPFARMGMTRQLKRNAKKLNLNEEQTRRLTKASTKAMDAIMPQMGVLMDAEATVDERNEAMEGIREEIETVNTDAESYMDSEQYQEFLEMQEQQLSQMNQLQDVMNGTAGGIQLPEAPPAPPAGGSRDG